MTGKLVFQTTASGPFYTIQVDGSDLRRVTDGLDPVWSPDGMQIAFARWREPRGVWVVNADGTGERRLFDWSEARWPTWSPDGQEILFSRQSGGRLEETERCLFGRCFTIGPQPHWILGIVSAADGSFSEPPGPVLVHAPDWSPDGQRLVFDGEQGLFVQTLEGTTTLQLTEDPNDTSPAWSPRPVDGRQQVIFTRRQHDHWEIYRIDADGGNPVRLTDTPARRDGVPGSSAAAAWSPDGQWLAFLTDRTGRWEIWIMGADGSEPRPMFRSALDGLTIEYASVAERAISWTE